MTRAQISAFMAEMGRKGGRIGGKRRMETMTPEARSANAAKAANARWSGVGRKVTPKWSRESWPSGTRFRIYLSGGAIMRDCIVTRYAAYSVRWFKSDYDGDDTEARRCAIKDFAADIAAGVIRKD